MTLVLLAVGLLVTAAGLVTIGFGIPINAFSLGNTLIISGTIAVASGLILIGLALVLGQLQRIAEALRGKPLPRAFVAAELIESARGCPRGAAAASAAAAQPSAEPQAAEPPHAPEPRSAGAPFSCDRQRAARPVRWIGCARNPSPSRHRAVRAYADPPAPLTVPNRRWSR